MEDKDNKLSLVTPIDELESKILEETDLDRLDDLVDLFNINLKKKDIIRAGKLNDLQDKITRQIENRIDKNSDQFSNKDLLDYFKTIQDTISKSNVDISELNMPTIQINQVNIENETKLSSESRRKVLDAVNAILSKTSEENSSNVEFEIMEEQNSVG